MMRTISESRTWHGQSAEISHFAFWTIFTRQSGAHWALGEWGDPACGRTVDPLCEYTSFLENWGDCRPRSSNYQYSRVMKRFK